MLTGILAFALFALMFAAMAVGVILAGKPLKGSCGGLNNPDGSCEICGASDLVDCQQPRG